MIPARGRCASRKDLESCGLSESVCISDVRPFTFLRKFTFSGKVPGAGFGWKRGDLAPMGALSGIVGLGCISDVRPFTFLRKFTFSGKVPKAGFRADSSRFGRATV